MVIPRLTCLHNNIVTSAHPLHTSSRIITTSKELSHRQVVVASGPTSELKVGDWVAINVDMFPRTTKPGKHDIGNKITVMPPLEKFNGTDYLFLTDRHIKYIIDK